jgi:hypothetical protein
MGQTWKQKLTSRKFLMAVATILVNLFFIVTGKEVDPEFVISLTTIAAAWITGETVLDRKALEINGDFGKRVAAAEMAELWRLINESTQAEEVGSVPSE